MTMKVVASLKPTTLRVVAEMARAAEAIGFDAAWVPEIQHEGFLPLPLIAAHTERMLFGNAVAIAFARSPMVIAHAAWDLAEQSGGRYVLGLGTQVRQHIERRFGMTWEAPAPRLREALLAIRAIWDCWQNGGALNFQGEFYRITLMTPYFNPGSIATPRIPIYIAGVNAPLCRVAGEVADGFHVHPFHSAKYLREVILPAIASGAAKAGRSTADVELSTFVFTITTDRDRESVRRLISFYGSTPTYRSLLELHGWADVGERLSRLASRGRWDDMPREIGDDVLETFAVVAPHADLPARIRARYAGLLSFVGPYESFVPGVDDLRWRSLVDGLHSPDNAGS